MTLEQLLFLLLFILIPVIYVARALKGRLERGAAEKVEPGLPPVPPRVRVSVPAAREPVRGVERPAAAPAPSRRRPHPLLADPRDVRRGIILMAILGPCRGAAPPARASGRPAGFPEALAD